MLGFQQVAAYTKQVIDRAVGGEKSLCVTRRFESPHLPFSLTRRLMGFFCSIVFPVSLPVHNARHDLFFRRTVTPKLSCHDNPG